MDNELFAQELRQTAETMLTAANRMQAAAKLADDSNAVFMGFMEQWATRLETLVRDFASRAEKQTENSDGVLAETTAAV